MKDEICIETLSPAEQKLLERLRQHAQERHCDCEPESCEGDDPRYICLDAGDAGAMVWCVCSGAVAICRDDDMEPVELFRVGGEKVR